MQYEFVVVGSGFSGNLLAWILASAGRSVAVVDRQVHPRFAIGESSTPLADFQLELLAEQFALPELRAMSRWGSWQRELPALRAGKKRGFSYFRHRPGQPFHEGRTHEASLLVAASEDDARSDTHWMRSDVDQWFCHRAAQAGARVWEGYRDLRLEQVPRGWQLNGTVAGAPRSLRCSFLIDASGGHGVLGNLLGLARVDEHLRTRTGALFGHFRQVGSMTRWLQSHGLSIDQDPFDADDAAQHHLLDQAWLWMLRFSEGTTSVGLVRGQAAWQKLATPAARWQAWQTELSRYPTLAELLREAVLIAPVRSADTPELGWMPRLGRLWSQAAGDDWAMLPSTVGVVDPLHSTGIAHALFGVRQLATLLVGWPAGERRSAALQCYGQAVVQEVRWIDRLVAPCYAAADEAFELFCAASSLYFAAAIACERQLADDGDCRDGFLLKDNAGFRRVVDGWTQRLEAYRQQSHRSASQCRALIAWLRSELEPWNDVGLLDPAHQHRLARSAAPK